MILRRSLFGPLRSFRLRVVLLAPTALLAAASPKQTALVGGRLIDRCGATPVNRIATLIDGERFNAVGTVATLPAPGRIQIGSTAGMSVLPGRWDSPVPPRRLGPSDCTHRDKTDPGRFATEIMPAAAQQRLLPGLTSARDLDAPLADRIGVRDRIAGGEIPQPTLDASGPFLPHEAHPGTEAFR